MEHTNSYLFHAQSGGLSKLELIPTMKILLHLLSFALSGKLLNMFNKP